MFIIRSSNEITFKKIPQQHKYFSKISISGHDIAKKLLINMNLFRMLDKKKEFIKTKFSFLCFTARNRKMFWQVLHVKRFSQVENKIICPKPYSDGSKIQLK